MVYDLCRSDDGKISIKQFFEVISFLKLKAIKNIETINFYLGSMIKKFALKGPSIETKKSTIQKKLIFIVTEKRVQLIYIFFTKGF